MEKFNYEVEEHDGDWMVYKINPITESKIAYKVELDAHGEGAHRCSCEFGSRQPEGQKTTRCKHVLMVMRAEGSNDQGN